MIRLWRPTHFLLTIFVYALLLSQGLLPLGLLSQGLLSRGLHSLGSSVQAKAINSVTGNNIAGNNVAGNNVAVGGRVWRDSNGDGVQGSDEPGIATVIVALFDVTGTLIDIGTTSSLGVYQFDGLQPGRYYVIPDQETLPSNLSPTLPNVGDNLVGDSVTYDSVTDSDLLPMLGRTAHTFSIPAGGRFLSLDMGFYPFATVGGRAWHDLNGDGIQDIGEAGHADIEAHLLYDTGWPGWDEPQRQPLITMTDENGYYHFSGLQPGHYHLLFIRPDNYRFSPPSQGHTSQLDSDAVPLLDNPARAETVHFELSPGQHRTGFDVGLYGITSVNGFAWTDSNGDGIQGQDESLLSGVDVQLFSYSQDVVTRAITNEQGRYAFTDILPGDYYLQFTAPHDLICTRRPQYKDDSFASSHMDPESAQITLRSLNMESADDVWVAGFTKPAILEDRVWLDEDLDGQLDPEEIGLADILVELYDHEDHLQDSTRSDSQGFFQFMGLTPGNYRLQVHHPDGYYFTQFSADGADIDQAEDGSSGVNQMNLDMIVSHVDPSTGSSGMVTLGPGLQNGFASASLALQEMTQVVEPTAIELMEFNASPVHTSTGGTQVLISWETQPDSGDGAEAQYHLYRSIYSEDTSYAPTDRALVARITSGSSVDTNEQWIDDSVLPGLHYRYWLVSIIEGQEGSEFGPIEAHPTRPIDLSDSRQVFLPLIYGYR